MKKIIVVSPVVPFPSHSGNSVRVAQVINSLKENGHDVFFVLCPIKAISDRRKDNAMREYMPNRTFELNKGNVCQGTILQKLLNFAKRYLGLKYITPIQDYMFEDGYITHTLVNQFKTLVDEIEPDVVICEYVILSKLIQSLPNSILKIVDTQDCFADRNKRIRAEGGQGLWWSLTQSQETDLLQRFDSVLAIQNIEAERFSRMLVETECTHGETEQSD